MSTSSDASWSVRHCSPGRAEKSAASFSHDARASGSVLRPDRESSTSFQYIVRPSKTHSNASCGGVLKFAGHIGAGTRKTPFHEWTYPWKGTPHRLEKRSRLLKNSAGSAFSPDCRCSK